MTLLCADTFSLPLSLFLFLRVQMLLIMVNRCCYASASVHQVSVLMQRRQQSGRTTPLRQCISFTLSPISSFTIFRKPLITHTLDTHLHSFPGTLERDFLVLDSFDLSDRTVRGRETVGGNHEDRKLTCPLSKAMCDVMFTSLNYALYFFYVV